VLGASANTISAITAVFAGISQIAEGSSIILPEEE
jgi:hypothetical protein